MIESKLGMVELSVVMEKLCNFETADSLAEYFHGCGILAQPRNARFCPIAQFVTMETGLSGVVVNANTVRVENEDGEQLVVHPNSDAMTDFVERYDRGHYPDLIEAGYEINEPYNCCPDCG